MQYRIAVYGVQCDVIYCSVLVSGYNVQQTDYDFYIQSLNGWSYLPHTLLSLHVLFCPVIRHLIYSTLFRPTTFCFILSHHLVSYPIPAYLSSQLRDERWGTQENYNYMMAIITTARNTWPQLEI